MRNLSIWWKSDGRLIFRRDQSSHLRDFDCMYVFVESERYTNCIRSSGLVGKWFSTGPSASMEGFSSVQRVQPKFLYIHLCIDNNNFKLGLRYIHHQAGRQRGSDG